MIGGRVGKREPRERKPGERVELGMDHIRYTILGLVMWL
jgi:hypothetical protein